MLRAVAEDEGILVVDSITELEDLLALHVAFRGRPVRGRRLGAVSNAGFEAVAIADNLGELSLAELAPSTRSALAEILARARVDGIVDLNNPVDLTPTVGDEGFAAAARAVLSDPGVDVGVIGCVPLTPTLSCLPASDDHAEDVAAPEAVASRLGVLFAAEETPWVAVVDAGALYDPFANLLRHAGVPTFRTADRAVRMLDRFCSERLRRQSRGAGVLVALGEQRPVLDVEPFAESMHRKNR